MKTILASLLIGSLAVRDPFWPIGYRSLAEREAEAAAQAAAKAVKAATQEQKTAPPAAKPEPPTPPPPITAAEWQAAQATLRISGVTRSKRPDTGSERTLVMINRTLYEPGATLCVTNQNVCFYWRIKPISELNVELEQLEAERLSTPLTKPQQE